MERALIVALSMCVGFACSDARIGDDAQCAGAACFGPVTRLTASAARLPFTNASGAATPAAITVVNVSGAPVHVFEVFVEGDDADQFELRLDPSAPGAPYVLVDDTLEPGASFVIEARYLGDRFDADVAVLTVRSDAFETPELSILLETLDDRLKLGLEPGRIDFGTVVVGEVGEQRVRIRNRGAERALLHSVTRAGSPDFSVAGAGGTVLEPGESTDVLVAYAPQSAAPDTGQVEVDFTYGDSEVRFVETADLAGEAVLVSPECLEAVAVVRQMTDGQGNPVVDGPAVQMLRVEPRSTVRLIGSDSWDPDGDPITEFSWQITQVPPDFSLDFSNPGSPVTDVQLLQLGRYAFELEVGDGFGERSCIPARVTIDVVEAP